MLLGALVVVGILSFSLFRAVRKPETKDSRFFLPHDLFIHLILLINYWVMLLIMLQSSMVIKETSILILASLFAPFLNWWHKKRTGEL